MPESSTHMNFVDICGDYICKNVIPHGKQSYLLYDNSNSTQKPPIVIGGVRPDVYFNHGGLLVIGEAKTWNDVDNIHSLRQFECYFKECETFDGETVIVLCTTWSFAPQLWLIAKRMKINGPYKARIIVLYELGRYKEM